MDFLPWTTFTRIVTRYHGDHRVRTLSRPEQFRCMAFGRLTYRGSLRDIQACLSAQAAKLCRMGFRKPVSRSTLADANERRDWRLYSAPTDCSTGLICDRTIVLNGFYSSQHYPQHLQ